MLLNKIVKDNKIRSRTNTDFSADNADLRPDSENKDRSSSRSASPRFSRFSSETERLFSVKHGVVKNYLCSSIINDEANKEPNISHKQSLIARGHRNTYSINLVASSPDKAVADSGCEQAVSGVKWMTDYYQQLSSQDKEDVQILPSSSSFRFGPGPLILSQGIVIMPAHTAGFRKEIAFDIVPADVPLLLSLQNLKSLNLTIQYSKDGRDTAIHNGVLFELELSQDHHWITLSKLGSLNSVVSSCDSNKSEKEDGDSQILSVIRSVDQNPINSLLTKKSVFSHDNEKCFQELRKVHCSGTHEPRQARG